MRLLPNYHAPYSVLSLALAANACQSPEATPPAESGFTATSDAGTGWTGRDSDATTGLSTTDRGGADVGVVEGCGTNNYLVRLPEESVNCEVLAGDLHGAGISVEAAEWIGPATGNPWCAIHTDSPVPNSLAEYDFFPDCPIVSPSGSSDPCKGIAQESLAVASSLMSAAFTGDKACDPSQKIIVYLLDSLECDGEDCEQILFDGSERHAHARAVYTNFAAAAAEDGPCVEMRFREVLPDGGSGRLSVWALKVREVLAETVLEPSPVIILSPLVWRFDELGATWAQEDARQTELIPRVLHGLAAEDVTLVIPTGNTHAIICDDNTGWLYPAQYCREGDQEFCDAMAVFAALDLDGQLSASTREDGSAALLAPGQLVLQTKDECGIVVGSSLAVGSGGGVLARIRLLRPDLGLPEVLRHLHATGVPILDAPGQEFWLPGGKPVDTANRVRSCEALEALVPEQRECLVAPRSPEDLLDALLASWVRDSPGGKCPNLAVVELSEGSPGLECDQPVDDHSLDRLTIPSAPKNSTKSTGAENSVEVQIELEPSLEYPEGTRCQVELTEAATQEAHGFSLALGDLQGRTLLRMKKSWQGNTGAAIVCELPTGSIVHETIPLLAGGALSADIFERDCQPILCTFCGTQPPCRLIDIMGGCGEDVHVRVVHAMDRFPCLWSIDACQSMQASRSTMRVEVAYTRDGVEFVQRGFLQSDDVLSLQHSQRGALGSK